MALGITKVIHVKVAHPGDSEFTKGQVVDLDDFIRMVMVVLKNGGEMPVAIPEPS